MFLSVQQILLELWNVKTGSSLHAPNEQVTFRTLKLSQNNRDRQQRCQRERKTETRKPSIHLPISELGWRLWSLAQPSTATRRTQAALSLSPAVSGCSTYSTRLGNLGHTVKNLLFQQSQADVAARAEVSVWSTLPEVGHVPQGQAADHGVWILTIFPQRVDD